MIEIKKTQDKELINKFLFEPEMYHAFCPDGSLTKDVDVTKWDHQIYIIYFDSKPAAIFFICEISPGCAGVHIGIAREFRGKNGYKIGQELLDFCFITKGLSRLIARIAKINKKCVLFCHQLGMRKYGGNDAFNYMEILYGRFI